MWIKLKSKFLELWAEIGFSGSVAWAEWRLVGERMWERAASSSTLSQGVSALLTRESKVVDLQSWGKDKFHGGTDDEQAGAMANEEMGQDVESDPGEPVIGIAATDVRLERSGSNSNLDRASQSTPGSKKSGTIKKEQKSGEPGSVGKDSSVDAGASTCGSAAATEGEGG